MGHLEKSKSREHAVPSTPGRKAFQKGILSSEKASESGKGAEMRKTVVSILRNKNFKNKLRKLGITRSDLKSAEFYVSIVGKDGLFYLTEKELKELNRKVGTNFSMKDVVYGDRELSESRKKTIRLYNAMAGILYWHMSQANGQVQISAPAQLPDSKIARVEAMAKKFANEFNLKEKWRYIAWLGKKKQVVVRYKGGTGLDEILTPKEYYDYVSSLVETPEDVRRILIGLVEYEEDPSNTLFTSLHVLTEGVGDCDNQSNLAKSLFIDMGKRSPDKHDYNPRIISMKEVGHAVCVFTGRDGKLYSLSQEKEIITFEDFADACDRFKKFKGKEYHLREILTWKHDSRLITDLDPKTLRPDGTRFSITFYGKEDLKNFDTGLLPKGWEKARKTQVEVRGVGFLIFNKGKLVYKRYDSGVEESHPRW